MLFGYKIWRWLLLFPGLAVAVVWRQGVCPRLVGVWRWWQWSQTLGSAVLVVAIGSGCLWESHAIWPLLLSPRSATNWAKGASTGEGGLELIPGATAGGWAGQTATAVAATRYPSLSNELDPLLVDAKPWASDSALTLSTAIDRRLPETICGLAGEDRKQAFIKAVLPTVLVALNEVRQERQLLFAIIGELGGRESEISFVEDEREWQQRLGADKTKFILALTRKYRTASAHELAAMVNVLPPSLIIAQGAIESAWGASRYAHESNNLFGMYAPAINAMDPTSDGGETPKIKAYDTLLESVRAYVLNINRLPAYKELRQIRAQTLDPMQIAEGLTHYSERKEYYIEDVKQIIALNKLRAYDTLILALVTAGDNFGPKKLLSA